MTRRTLILGLGCLRRQHLTPSAFPWCVDRTAHLARRKIHCGPLPGEQGAIELTRLHIALDAYMWRPNPETMARARQELARVQAYTVDAQDFRWREMHYFCTILLEVEEWRPEWRWTLPDTSGWPKISQTS